MVATVGIEDSEGRVFNITSGITAGVQDAESRVFSVYNFPSVGEQVSEERNNVVVKRDSVIDVSEARVFSVVRGRLESHRVRAFPFRLDGHNQVALRLGEAETLVYDFTTGQWSRWSSEVDNNVWRPSTGNNWTGMGKAFYDSGLTSDVILGDDTFGLLWGLNPNSGIDEHPDPLRPDLPYIRKVVGGVSMRLRDTLKVGAAYLTADRGTPQVTGATISLRTSDDYGKNWQDQGTITVQPGNYDQEFVWRSIGLVKAPGRIFEISDNGATVRIDSLDMR
jgi:hypothetical protein